MTDIQQRWLTFKQAAHYCGYHSVNHFRSIVKDYNIPRHGPRHNRFDRFELDEWMKNPDIFLSYNHLIKRKRAFTPVKV